jgi:AcrR family transcriptional regulator
MNRTLVPKEGPKLRLVEAAEKLFAQNGFDVVSVRDITQAAGGNVAAVNYYFGSRDALVEVVMTRYLVPVNEERLARLEAAERKWAGQAVPVEDVVAAFVRPLITQVENSGLSESLFYRLVGRIFGSHGVAIPATLQTQMGVLIDRFTRALGKALPTVAEEELVWRLHFVVGAMIYMLTHGETVPRLAPGAAGTSGMDATLERLLRFTVAGLRDGVMSPPADQASSNGHASDGFGVTVQGAGQELAGGPGAPLQGGEAPEEDHEGTSQTAEQVPDEDQEWTSQTVEQVPDEDQEWTSQTVEQAPDQAPDEDQEATSQTAEQAPDQAPDEDQEVTSQTAEQVPDGGHWPLPQGADEPPAKPGKKRAKKVEQDSPQVMFEF